MTETQERLLEYIRDHRRQTGRSPSIQEMTDSLGYADTRGVRYQLEQLESLGRVRRLPGSRGIEIVGEPIAPIPPVPFLGVVTCGTGMREPGEGGQEYVDFAKILSREGVVAYRAVGDSMRDACIAPGDFILVRPCPDPENGETVVCQLRNEMICKRYKRLSKKRVQLKNGSGETLEVDLTRDEFRVIGVLHAVIRRA